MQSMDYNSIDQLWHDAINKIEALGFDHPSRNGNSKELLGYVGILTNIELNFLTDPTRNLSPIYAAGEMLWYLSGDNDGEMISYYAPQYKKFLSSVVGSFRGYAYGAYGPKIFKCLPELLLMLSSQPETRQAVINFYDSGDFIAAYSGRHPDIPCTLSLQFLVRKGALHCICTMRSNDVWLGMPYDIFCFTTLQMLMAEHLCLDYGCYQHQAGSLHLYERDYEKVQQIGLFPADSIVYSHREKVPFDLFDRLLRIRGKEKEIRLYGTNDGLDNLVEEYGIQSRLLLLLLLAAMQKEGTEFIDTDKYMDSFLYRRAKSWQKKRDTQMKNS